MRPAPGGRALEVALRYVGVPFFLVACTVAYYGQFHRVQSADTLGALYTSVALLEHGSVDLDPYVPYVQERVGEFTYMLTTSDEGNVVNKTPVASSVLALPAVAAFSAAGADAPDSHAWYEAGFLTAALAAAASVGLLWLTLLRLTTRPRAALLAATFAWATLHWGVTGQALWQHGGATLALCAALLALVARRPGLAGLALGTMIAFRFSTPVLAVALVPLVGWSPRAWGRLAAGAAPPLAAVAAYNLAVFGSPVEQGYGTAHVVGMLAGLPVIAAALVAAVVAGRRLLPARARLPSLALALLALGAVAVAAAPSSAGRVLEGLGGLLIAPGHGLLVYSPVLAFAVVGAVRGRRVPLYRAAALGSAAYCVVMANSTQWYGGEAFGARRIVEIVPLLVVLLVPALEALDRPVRRLLFGAALAWSFAVQLLAAATWPPGDWWDVHDLTRRSTWWSPTDNELTAALLDEPDVVWRTAAMLGVVAAGVALGLLAGRVRRDLLAPASGSAARAAR